MITNKAKAFEELKAQLRSSARNTGSGAVDMMWGSIALAVRLEIITDDDADELRDWSVEVTRRSRR